MTDLLLTRRRLCYAIAEALQPAPGERYDVEQAAEIIDAHLPHSMVEAQAVLDELTERKEPCEAQN